MKKAIIIISSLLLLSSCSKEITSKEENRPVKEMEKVEEQSSTPLYQEIVDEEVVFKTSTPVPMDPTLPLESLNGFTPKPRENENKASYHMKLTMDESKTFFVDANIVVENLSKDSWKDLIFHFMPNAFTEKNNLKFMESFAYVKMGEVTVNKEKVEYKVQQDNLQLLLNEPLENNQKVDVSIEYSFTLPKMGYRFSEVEDHAFLAQWYPMLATYHSGWGKADFSLGGESYHTDFSDFRVEYSLPNHYMIASSSDNDPNEPSNKGVLDATNVKEMHMAILKDMPMTTKEINGTEIRIFSNVEDKDYQQEYLDVAVNTLQFYNDYFGPYPHKQLDIIMDESGMEYPGIVTVARGNRNKHTLVHEIAHQWFYGMVSNHPYHTPWIDEGLTNFATYLYFVEGENLYPNVVFEKAQKDLERSLEHGPIKPINLPINGYFDQSMSYHGSVYQYSSLKLWELSEKNAERGLEYLSTYFNLYKYKEVDANEWLRYTRAFFQIEDVNELSDWISFE
ncbi:M1 family metallopeptidase [Cytobacillus sp. FJAT-54145]|uniref:M1 family metallopeptidase n=1 Tax=Cytobacillus spartinae TaxID=3299023 RepID=A0ABW6K8J5_9BACI